MADTQGILPPTNGEAKESKKSNIVIGCLIFATIMAVIGGAILFFAFMSFNGIIERGRIESQTRIIGQLTLGCKLYAQENDGNYPEQLQDLCQDYFDESILTAVNPKTNTKGSFTYFKGRTDKSDKNALLIGSPFVFRRKRMIGLRDREVKVISEIDYQKLLNLPENNL